MADEPTVPVTRTALPCIFPVADEENPWGTWVRIVPSAYGVSIEVFEGQPTGETPGWQSMCAIHVDAAFGNQVKVQLWDEDTDQEADDPNVVVLVKDVKHWQRPDWKEEEE